MAPRFCANPDLLDVAVLEPLFDFVVAFGLEGVDGAGGPYTAPSPIAAGPDPASRRFHSAIAKGAR